MRRGFGRGLPDHDFDPESGAPGAAQLASAAPVFGVGWERPP